ncbi:MAG: hypothetical protein JWO85_1399, partial [Candidatus Eremiobacteraeota bacterium]|nr:hypothetical protein [Candidatus Eremiobacteraeota bacterium]
PARLPTAAGAAHRRSCRTARRGGTRKERAPGWAQRCMPRRDRVRAKATLRRKKMEPHARATIATIGPPAPAPPMDRLRRQRRRLPHPSVHGTKRRARSREDRTRNLAHRPPVERRAAGAAHRRSCRTARRGGTRKERAPGWAQRRRSRRLRPDEREAAALPTARRALAASVRIALIAPTAPATTDPQVQGRGSLAHQSGGPVLRRVRFRDYPAWNEERCARVGPRHARALTPAHRQPPRAPRPAHRHSGRTIQRRRSRKDGATDDRIQRPVKRHARVPAAMLGVAPWRRVRLLLPPSADAREAAALPSARPTPPAAASVATKRRERRASGVSLDRRCECRTPALAGRCRPRAAQRRGKRAGTKGQRPNLRFRARAKAPRATSRAHRRPPRTMRCRRFQADRAANDAARRREKRSQARAPSATRATSRLRTRTAMPRRPRQEKRTPPVPQPRSGERDPFATIATIATFAMIEMLATDRDDRARRTFVAFRFSRPTVPLVRDGMRWMHRQSWRRRPHLQEAEAPRKARPTRASAEAPRSMELRSTRSAAARAPLTEGGQHPRREAPTLPRKTVPPRRRPATRRRRRRLPRGTRACPLRTSEAGAPPR